MFIKKIDIKQGENNAFNIIFNDRLNVIKSNDLIKDIIALLMDDPISKTYPNTTSFFATVQVDDKIFNIGGEKLLGEKVWSVICYRDGSNEDCIAEYLSLLRQCSEEKCFNNFSNFKRKNYPHRLYCYKDSERYYPQGDFSRVTDGYGCTRSFRAFMNEYIQNFLPVKLCANKNYYLNLSPDGRFVVKDQNTDEISLSEGENVLYNYHCFLCLADFWSRAQKIRDFNRVNKPLVISDFIEKLDESISIAEILAKTNDIERQTIIYVPKMIHKLYYDNICQEVGYGR